MINELNDSSVLDCFELDTLDIGGDPCHVAIVLCYDLDSDFYTVEKFAGSKSRDLESFESGDQAAAFFDLWVQDVKRDDAENRAEAQAI